MTVTLRMIVKLMKYPMNNRLGIQLNSNRNYLYSSSPTTMNILAKTSPQLITTASASSFVVASQCINNNICPKMHLFPSSSGSGGGSLSFSFNQFVMFIGDGLFTYGTYHVVQTQVILLFL